MAFASFCDVNTPAMANFKLPAWSHWTRSWTDVCAVDFHPLVWAHSSTSMNKVYINKYQSIRERNVGENLQSKKGKKKQKLGNWNQSEMIETHSNYQWWLQM